MSGTGMPISHPATRTGFRPNRSASAPAARLVAAFASPKATTNVSTEANPASPKTSVASSGRTVRSCPIIPPTSPLTATSKRELGEVWPQAELDRRIGDRACRWPVRVHAASGNRRPVRRYVLQPPFALDLDLAAGLEVIRGAKALVHGLRDLDPTRKPARLHPARGVHRVAPQVVDELAPADDSRDHRSALHPDSNPEVDVQCLAQPAELAPASRVPCPPRPRHDPAGDREVLPPPCRRRPRS